MHIEMAGQAIGEHLQLFFVVRLTMAVTAIRNLTVLLVTLDARDLAVLTRCAPPLTVDIIMTTAARLNIRIPWESDLQRCVDTVMTAHAVLNRLLCIMTIMTFKAVRYVAVLLMMAILAPLFSVGTRELLQLFCRSGMTIRTSTAKTLHRRNQQGRMRVLMAIKAVGLLRPMLLPMARGAQRHQVVIIVFARAVCVENLVTFLAGKAMFATGSLQMGKLARMALTTFCRL